MSLDLTPYLDAIESDMQTVVCSHRAPRTGCTPCCGTMGWQDSAGQPTDGRHGKRLRPCSASRL